MHRALRWVQVGGLAALAVATPLWLGGAPPAARAAGVVRAALLVLPEAWPRAARGERPDSSERAWLCPWLAVTALIALQLVPLPAPALGLVGAYPEALLALADPPVSRLSPMPLETLAYWALFTSYWALAWLVSRLAPRQVGLLVAALGAISVFESLYGIRALARGSDDILGIWVRPLTEDATGTYVNRNHYAGLLAICWPLALAALLSAGARAERPLPDPLRFGAAALLSLVVGAGLVASHSRLGLLAALAGLATWLAVSTRSEPGAASAPGWLRWTLPAALAFGALWLGTDRWAQRVAELDRLPGRLLVWSSLLRLPARAWLLGAGAGSFPDVFKTVQPAVLHTSYATAHSDWLELLLDFGVLGTAALVAAFAFWWRRARPARRGELHAGALGAIVAVAVHSAADFDLQVPGTALAFWICVGIASNGALAARSGLLRRRAPGLSAAGPRVVGRFGAMQKYPMETDGSERSCTSR